MPVISEAGASRTGPGASDPEISRLTGQLILMQFTGSQPSDAGLKAIRAMLHAGTIAGAVFTSENIRSRAQIKELMKFLKPTTGMQSRPLFAIREIGGGLDGLPAVRDFEQWPSQSEVAAKGDPEYAHSTYRSMGSSLAVLGFNLNFGPILSRGRGARGATASFGDNPLQAGVFAKTFILGHREEHVIPVPIVDSSNLSLAALKTLLVQYPDTPIAAYIVPSNPASPFAVFGALVRGPHFCFVALPSEEGSEAVAAFNRGCDVIVANGGSDNPALVRDRIAQAIYEAIQRNELTLDALNAASQRLISLRTSMSALYDGPRARFSAQK
ncbi:MAG: glycoside hydrolase family 3 N-terminal domain-containing protein [Rhodomicrobium sp.]